MHTCKLFVVLVLFLQNTNSLPLDITATPRGITDYGYGSEGAFIKHNHKLYENDNHRLDGSVYAQKNFHENRPLVTGGTLDYSHLPSKSQFSFGAENTRGYGTDLSAGGQYNFYQSKSGTIGAYGEYSRNLGGRSSEPRYEYGIRGKFTF